jgi:hypothetical protein
MEDDTENNRQHDADGILPLAGVSRQGCVRTVDNAAETAGLMVLPSLFFAGIQSLPARPPLEISS